MLDQCASVSPTIPPPAWPAYVDVVLPLRLHRHFTYLVPSDLKGKVAVGQSVIVPFGAQDLHGLVIAVHLQLPPGAPPRGIKAIRSLAETRSDEQLTAHQLELSRWIAERYAAPRGQCIKLVSPPLGQVGRKRVRALISEQGLASLSTGEDTGSLDRQLLLRLARRPKGLTATTLTQGDKSSAMRMIQALIRNGLLLRLDEPAIPRPSRSEKSSVSAPSHALSKRVAFDGTAHPPVHAASWPATVGELLNRDAFASVLVQADGDTRLWCLVQAVQETLCRGRRVLVITGDVEHANRLTEALAVTGQHPLLLHSGLTARTRTAVWSSAHKPSATVVVGTRLAAFAPIERLGLVWVEGEDDASLKEEQVPRYHAREVAHRRAVSDGGLLVLASSHPSLESWSAVRQGETAAYVYRDLMAYPSVRVIDQKDYAFASVPGTCLSPPLCDGLREALRQNALAVVYLNRKGFATVLHCGDCGAMPRCDVCSVTLSFYKRSNHMRCHYCGRTKPVPDHCSQCQSLKLELVGSGTERIEEAVRRMFPQARVGRVDGETIRRPADARALRRALAAGDLDILIGTQMLFRLGLRSVAAFVAVPDSDAALHIPDFRSAEQMYQSLVDAAELARPAHAGGEIMVQTRFPDHPAMLALTQGDDALFLDSELMLRQLLSYPPHTHLIRLDVSGTIEPVVAQAAGRWTTLLRAQVAGSERVGSHDGRRTIAAQRLTGVGGEGREPVILGPSPAPHAMARGRYCWQILIKAVSVKSATEIVALTLAVMERGPRRGALRFDIDVDPVTMG